MTHISLFGSYGGPEKGLLKIAAGVVSDGYSAGAVPAEWPEDTQCKGQGLLPGSGTHSAHVQSL